MNFPLWLCACECIRMRWGGARISQAGYQITSFDRILKYFHSRNEMKSNWSLPPSLSQRTWNVFEWIAIKPSANRFHSVPTTTKWKCQPWCLLSFNGNGVAGLRNASIKKNRMLHAQIQHRTNYLSSYRYNNSPESTLMNVHTNWRTLETTKCIQPLNILIVILTYKFMKMKMKIENGKKNKTEKKEKCGKRRAKWAKIA